MSDTQFSTGEKPKNDPPDLNESQWFCAQISPHDKQSVDIVLSVSRRYCISGSCLAKVTAGSIRILGYCATENSEQFEIHAPLSNNQYTIETGTSGISYSELETKFPHLANVAENFRSRRLVVVTLSKLPCPNILTIVNSAASLDGKPIVPLLPNNVLYSPSTRLVFDIAGAIFGIDDRPAVEMWPQLQNALTSIVDQSMHFDLEANNSSCRPIVIMVCGEKNAGKSTTCRAIINSLLSVNAFKQKGVSFFECDVGQTEFTPSAIVSWSLIKKPLVEPPFMHMNCGSAVDNDDCAQFHGTFYGDLSPGQSPNRYFDCLKMTCSKIPQWARSNVPLIVNTMGWMKSLGLALLVDTYRLFQPDIVLHLRAEQDNSPSLTPQFFATADGINSTNGPNAKSFQHVLLDIPIQRKPVAAKIGISQHSGPPPFFLRALSTVGHLALANDVKSPSLLRNLPKCELPVCENPRYIFGGVCHERVPPGETRRALLGSLVALCRINVRLPPGLPPNSFLLTLPSGWIENDWFGLGIVLDIDEHNKKAIIATPLADRPEVLAKVNCLLRGSVTITDSVMAEIVPEHLRQNVIPPGLQVQTSNQPEFDDGPFDAQRFGGRRDYMRRKRGMPNGTSSANYDRAKNSF